MLSAFSNLQGRIYPPPPSPPKRMLRFTLIYGTFHFLQKLKLAVRFPYVEAASDQDTAKKPTRDLVATRPPLCRFPSYKIRVRIDRPEGNDGRTACSLVLSRWKRSGHDFQNVILTRCQAECSNASSNARGPLSCRGTYSREPRQETYLFHRNAAIFRDVVGSPKLLLRLLHIFTHDHFLR